MTHEIGTNAGIVWKAVAARNGKASFTELVEGTGLYKAQILLALGWLEREGQVSLHGEDGMVEAVTLYQERYY